MSNETKRMSVFQASRVVTALVLASVSAAAWSQADADYDAEVSAQIKELEKQLQVISRMAADGSDVDEQIAAMRSEIDALKQEVSVATGQATPETETAAAEPEPGVQGTPSPLQRDSDDDFKTGQDLLDQSFPGSLPIPGSNVRFKVGGYAKLDFIQDFDFVGDRFEFELGSIPVEGTPEYELGGQTTMHAKETRFNFDFRSIARNEERGWEFPLQVFLEFDFFDDRESFRLQPRQRHAYGVIGRFLAGRTWTINTDLAILAPTIDFSGGDSLYGNRVDQFRFADNLSDSLSYTVGIEESTASIGNPDGVDGANRSSLPNFAGHLRWTAANKAHVQFGIDVFRLEWQGGATGPSDEELGYGATLSATTPLGRSNRDKLSGAVTFGSGAAHRVVSLNFDGGNSAVITEEGLDAMSHWQVYGGYSHYWTDSLNSSIALAHAELDNSEFQGGEAISQASSVHINLVWFPYKKVSAGVEYMWGRRENNNGAAGTANRIQAMMKFVFN